MLRFLEKYRWPLAVFLAAFLIRLVYLVQYQSFPAFYQPMVDELWHLEWARDILNANFRGDEAYFRGPLYPYLLAFFLAITGDSIFWSRFLQIIIASISAVFILHIGQRLISRKVGIIAAFAYAAYGTFIFYDTMFLIPVLFVFLILLAVYLMIRCRERLDPAPWLLTGLIMGLAAIARPNILVVLPLVMIWLYFEIPEKPEMKRRLLRPIIFLAAVLIPVFSVTLRNYLVTDEFILISSQGGVNFYIGNNPETEGLTMLMPEIDLDESLPWNEFTEATRQAAENETGHTLTAAGESSFWTGKALDFIWHNPGKFIGTTFKKFVYLCLGFENSDQTDIYFNRKYSWVLTLLVWKSPIYFPFGLVLPLALLGMVHLWYQRKRLALLYIFIIGYIPTIVLFLVTARHRLPIIPFLLIFAGAGAAALIDFIRGRNYRRLAVYGAVLICLMVILNRTYFDIGFENKFQIHFNLALTYEKQDRLDKAESEYREALSHYPYSATALNNLGMLLHRQNRSREALAELEKAARAQPDYAEVINNIGLVYEDMGDRQKAEKYYQRALSLDPNLYQGYINMGDLYLERGEFDRAEQAYRTARKIAPRNEKILFKLGALYARQQRFVEAEKMFTEGSAWGAPGAIDFVNWGNIYYATRQPDRAAELYRQAIEKDPELTQAYFNLALTLDNSGHPPDTVRHYLRQALNVDPEFQPARDFLQRLKE